MDVDITAVHELWAAPKENWLDHFVSGSKFKQLLNAESKSDAQREELRTLVVQFAEQAVQVEVETETLVKKQFGAEDITFHQRKAACLWLCSLSSLAAIDWQFESLVERAEDLLVVNAIFERIELWKEDLHSPSSSSSSISFPSFLLSRWHLFVYARFRMPPPEAKQTVSNPCNQLDPALLRFEQARTLIAKLRDRVDLAQQRLEFMLTERAELRVPRPDCFIDPFLQEGGLSLSIGILGENVLAAEESALRPRLPSGSEEHTVVVPMEAVAQRIHFELASSFFCGARMVKSLSSLKQLLRVLPSFAPSPPPHPLVKIDPRKVNGFTAAFRMPSPYEKAAPSTSHAEVSGEITAAADAHPRQVPQRRYGTRRDRAVEEKCRVLSLPAAAARLCPLAAADDLACGMPVVGWRTKLQRADEQTKTQAVERLRLLSTSSASLPASNRAMARGTARFLSVAVDGPVVQPLLDALPSASAPDAARAALQADALRTADPQPPPSAASIRAMAASDKPYWTLLTSFDAAELQAAFKLEGAQYARPLMLRFPEVLADLLLTGGGGANGGGKRAQFDELHALLLGKLQQLTEMGDSLRWQTCLDAFVPILGLNTTQTLLEMSIYEATRVQMLCLNRQLITPHSDLRQQQVTLVQGVARKLVKISQVPPLIAPMVSFLLNLGEFVFVCESLDTGAGSSNLLLNAGRILAAFGGLPLNDTALAAQCKQVALTWHGLISPFFEAVASKRRHDGFTTMHLRDSSRVRVDLMRLFEAIKLPKLQIFLVSYFAHLYTQALAARGRVHLRVHAQHGDLFAGTSLQLAHTESVEEVLSLLLDRALALVPHCATLLRTKADFAYVRNQLNEAAISYCELLVAVKPSLALPLPAGPDTEKVVDESVWNHMRICLRKAAQPTLAACLCQLFKTGRAKEFRKAAEAVQERSCLDASDDCFGLIYDLQLAEALTDAYRKSDQQQKLEALLEVIATPTMNPNNGPEVVEREMRRKQKRLLNTLAALHFGVHS